MNPFVRFGDGEADRRRGKTRQSEEEGEAGRRFAGRPRPAETFEIADH